MMVAETLVERARAMGISLAAEGGYIAARPKGRTPPELAAAFRAHKGELLTHLRVQQEEAEIDRVAQANAKPDRARVNEALALLSRLRCYGLPADWIPAGREIALRLEPLKDADPGTILLALRDFEHELIAWGGAPDSELVEAVAMVERRFTGARLVEVRKLQ